VPAAAGGLTPAAVLALQRTVGNRGVAQLLSPANRQMLARAMKFELQTTNLVWRKRPGHSELLPRKFGPSNADFLHKGTIGRPPTKKKEGTAVELQSETGGVIEFETAEWFTDWCQLHDTIQEAVDMTKEIDKKAASDPLGTHDGHTLVEFPWDVGHLKKKSKSFSSGLRSGEKLIVELVDPEWWAGVQSSESIDLSQYEDFLKEHERTSWATDAIARAKELADAVNPKKDPDVNLRSFLEIVLDYIFNAQNDWKYTEKQAPKEYLSLMARTSFSSIYRELLSRKEQRMFDEIVRKGAILDKMGLTKKSLFYAHGVHTHLRKLTVDSWLRSIVSKGHVKAHKKERRSEKDKLSEPTPGNAMGRFDVEKDAGEEDTMLVRFETRATKQTAKWGTTAHPHQVKRDDWVAYAEERFSEAHRRRNRSGSTALSYDPRACKPKKSP
jgi:hypothetical protein